MDKLRKKQIIITGGAGFIGSHIAHGVKKRGADVILILRRSTDVWRIAELMDEVCVVRVDDVFDYSTLENEISGADCLLHLGFSGVNQNERGIDTVYFQNVKNTETLLRLAASKKIRRFIYTGSCFEYPAGSRIDERTPPKAVNVYAAAKTSGWHLAEAYHYMHGLDVIGLRPFTVYGPFESAHRLIPTLIVSAFAGKDVGLTAGDQMRDFIYIDDVTEAYMRAIVSEDLKPAEIYNVSTGIDTSVLDVVTVLSRFLDNKPVVNLGKIPYRDNEYMVLSGDFSKLKNSINWEPSVCLADGLKLTLEWFKQNLVIYKKYYP